VEPVIIIVASSLALGFIAGYGPLRNLSPSQSKITEAFKILK